nr:hypothetical protein K-LCC10_0439 [Kaumoebavirus]
MIKIICTDNTIEVSASILKDIPYFKPMLEGGWEKNEIVVEEDSETFTTVLNCLKNEFEYELHLNDYYIYKAYYFYSCAEPSRYFFINNGKVCSIEKCIINHFAKIHLNDEFASVAYDIKDVREALNWITTYVVKGNHTRRISVEAVNFICDYILIGQKNLMSFIIHKDEVICERTFVWISGRDKTKVICQDPAIFTLLKEYIEDQMSSIDNMMWRKLKKFLASHYAQYGELTYKYFSGDSGGLCYPSCPSGNPNQRYF